MANKRFEMDRLRLDATRIGAFAVARLEREVNRAVMASRAVSLAIEAEPNMPDERYAVFGARLVKDNPSVINIAAAPGLVVNHVYPVQPNGKVLGTDYRNVPSQLPDVLRAAASPEAILVGPLDLLQGGRGFILRQGFTSRDANGRATAGIVSIVLDAETFLAAAGLTGSHDKFSIAVRKIDAGFNGAEVIAGNAAIFDDAPVVFDVPILSSVWQIGLAPRNGWPVLSAVFVPVSLAIAGIAFLCFLTFVMFDTSRRRKESAEYQLNVALASIDDGFALFNPDGQLLAANRRYCSVMAGTESIPVGTTHTDILTFACTQSLFTNPESGSEDWIAERADPVGPDRFEWQAKTPDGRWFNVNQRRLEGGGMSVVMSNVTALMSALKESEAANRAKSRFLDAMSHELRTPLSVLIGYNAFLTQPMNLLEAKELRSTIEAGGRKTESRQAFERFILKVTTLSDKVAQSSRQLQDMISKLLDVSGKEVEQSTGRQRVRAGALLGPLADRFRAVAERKGLEYRVLIEETVLSADPIMAERALSCIIENAIKFTDEGVIEVSLKPISADKVVFTVTDSGRGIPEQYRARLGKVFEKGNEARFGGTAGLGLGLSIARQIAKDHGSQLELEQGFGNGTRVSMQFDRWTNAVGDDDISRGDTPSNGSGPRSSTIRSGSQRFDDPSKIGIAS